MSCIIIDDEVYSCIIYTLLSDQRDRNYVKLWMGIHPSFDTDCVDVTKPESHGEQILRGFFEDIRKHNYEAYGEIYKNHPNIHAVATDGGKFIYSPRRRVLPLMQVYKLLACIDYQCCDSDRYNNGDDSRRMEKIMERIAKHIILNTCEAQLYGWGDLSVKKFEEIPEYYKPNSKSFCGA